MARHDDDYRLRNRTSRFGGDRHYTERNASHRDSMSGSRAGGCDDDSGGPGAYGSSHDLHDRAGGGTGRGYGSEREDDSRWFGRPEGNRFDGDNRYGGYGGERSDSRRSGRYGEHAEEDRRYGGRSAYGRGSYDQDHEGMSGGARGGYEGRYGSEYGSAYAENYSQRGLAGTGAGRGAGSSMYGRGMSDGPGNGGQYGGEAMYGRGAGAGRYGSEHASRGGGYGIGASPEYRGEHGEHHGKGPRGYTRSDDRIKEDVCDCLTDDPMLDAGDIEVQVKNGDVTLNGEVKDRLAKRHAEDMIERVSGVKNVQNSLKVKEKHRQGSTAMTHMGTGQNSTSQNNTGQNSGNQSGSHSAQSGSSQGKTQSGASHS
jgi:hypothetical protein